MKKWNRYNDTIKWRLLRKLKWSSKEKRDVKYILDHYEYENINHKAKKILRKTWVINGVGPQYILKLSKIIGKIITFIFWLVDCERHDVNYFIWWTEKDRKKADDGLLKYSLYSVIKIFERLYFHEKALINIILIFLYLLSSILYFILLFISIFLVLWAYLVLRAFWKKAFNEIYF